MNIELLRRPTRPTRRGLLALPLIAVLWMGIAAAPVGAAGSATYRDCSQLALVPNADLHRCDLSDTTIIGLDLHGMYASWSDLSRVNGGCDPDLPRTNLAGARIARAILVDAKLCDAILSDADLHGSDMSGVSLEDASLFRANLSWVTLDGLPADPAARASHPALSDVAFEAKRKGVLESLPAECWEAGGSR